MTDRLKGFLKTITNRWNKLTGAQKTAVISIIATVFLAFIILYFFASRTNYETLISSDNTKDISTVADLLEGEGIEYKLASDNRSLLVDSSKYSDAVLLVYSSDVPTTGLTVDELLNNGLNTTNSERNLKNHLYIQTEIRRNLLNMNGVTDAQVTYVPQDNSYSILSERDDYPASVALIVNSDFELTSAQTIAEYVAASIGNESTEKIKVVDQNGNLLFGGKDDLYTGNVDSVLDYREKLQNTYNNNIYILLMKLGFDDIQSMFNWSLNMDKVTELYTEQIPADGQDQGLYKHYYSYEAKNTAGEVSGIPGTDNNDDTTYNIDQGIINQGSNVNTTEIEYLPSERVTNTEYEVGAVIPGESSGSIICTKVVTYEEAELEAAGLLDGISFEEYTQANNERVQMEVTDEVYNLVSMATGVPQNRIQIMAYEQPLFIPKTTTPINSTLIFQISLVALIIGLLLLVVFKGTKPVEVMETEPELSVEQLLATTHEPELSDIKLNEKSEPKRVIEKFVDEDPESVARLLRNWLSEDEWE